MSVLYLSRRSFVAGSTVAADVIRHFEHMIDVAGEDHVSIGTDGGVSAEVVTEEFKARFAGFVSERCARGISAPESGETVLGDLEGLMDRTNYQQNQSVRGGCLPL